MLFVISMAKVLKIKVFVDKILAKQNHINGFNLSEILVIIYLPVIILNMKAN